MIAQVDQELCAGCGVCLDVCSPGAIRLVDQRAVIDEVLCTGCEACIEACPNHAISLRSIPEPRMMIVKVPDTKSPPVPLREETALPVSTAPARSLAPIAGAALAFLGREAAPRLVDMVISALERRFGLPTATNRTSQPSTSRITPLRSVSERSRGSRRQVRYRKRWKNNRNITERR